MNRFTMVARVAMRPPAERTRAMTALPPLSSPDTATAVVGLRSQYGQGLLGVPRSGLRLTWRAASDDPGAHVIGYQLATGEAGGRMRELEPVAAEAGIGIPLTGDLQPRERRAFSVRVATPTGWTPWSAPLVVEAGVDGPDLAASVVGIDTPVDGPVQLLRKEVV